MVIRNIVVVASALALLCACAHQPGEHPISTPVVAPEAAPVLRPAPDKGPVVTLPGAICDRNRDANTIVRVQTAVAKLMPRLQADPAFGGAWYEHAPCYRIVFAFTDGQPRPWVIDEAEPELRPYIAFGRTMLADAERQQAARQIMSAINAAGVRFAIFTMSSHPEEFMVGVRTEAEAVIVRSIIPVRYRSITKVEVGDFKHRPE